MRKVAKWLLAFYLAQAVIGTAIGVYVGIEFSERFPPGTLTKVWENYRG